MKETELLAAFIRDVFGDLLGYVGPVSGSPVYTLKRESLVQVDGKFAEPLADPHANDLQQLDRPERRLLADFWNQWLATLETIRIVDPACGSGQEGMAMRRRGDDQDATR